MQLKFFFSYLGFESCNERVAFIKNIPDTGLTDKEMLDLYQKTRDMQVLGILFQRYMDLLYGVCLKYLKEPETARDAVMSIFEELVQKLHKHEVDNFKSWLYTVGKNYCLMQLRTPRHLKTIEIKTEIVQYEEDLHLNGVFTREASLQQLENCLQTLPADQKQAVELFYLQNKCYQEIASIMDQEWNKVRSFIQNGRRNLKLCMEKKAVIKQMDT